jgi:hypothetical protein
MTSGGITKQRACFWVAVAFFVAAMFCAVEAMTGGGDAYRAAALVAFMFGGISAAGFVAQILIKRSEASHTN